MCSHCQGMNNIEEEVQQNISLNPYIYWNNSQEIIGNNISYFYWIPQENNLENFM